ncbi:MAG TPA: hypothetical protein VLB02_02260, partial [Candidatus Paceibacterota bacterium]|nr:hypothetical protein [Candidatus Paceibacterota bacterium]
IAVHSGYYYHDTRQYSEIEGSTAEVRIVSALVEGVVGEDMKKFLAVQEILGKIMAEASALVTSVQKKEIVQ